MASNNVKSVVVFGGGLASTLCVLSLVKNLPETIRVIWLEPEHYPETDILFGTMAPPSFYSLLLKVGVSEPEILLNTKSSLSYGTQYKNWGLYGRSWMQSYNKSLPNIGGVAFHQLLRRFCNSGSSISNLDPYLMASKAALGGVFAHPRDDLKSPLSSAEYGFNFLPKNWSEFLSSLIQNLNIRHIKSDVLEAERDTQRVTSVKLSNGDTVNADFFIDCSPCPSTKTLLGSDDWKHNKTLLLETWADTSVKPKNGTRIVTGEKNGWSSLTPLQNETLTMRISLEDSDAPEVHHRLANQSSTQQVEFGSKKTAWTGNCLSLGQSAAVIEPITPAPLMMLQADIERLLELFPISKNMEVERREYNRRFNDDLTHLRIFQKSFFKINDLPRTPYWQSSAIERTCEKLSVKINQFENRGVVVRYDYEPFEEQDWVTLHYGLGRIPKKYDLLADRMDLQSIEAVLKDMQTSIIKITEKMPPHSVYMGRFLEYLRKKYA